MSSKLRRHGLRPPRLVPALLGVVSLALAACGSSAASGSSTSTTKPTTAASEAAYSACLKQHGVTLPSFPHGTGGPPPSGGTRPTFPAGGGSGFGQFRNNPTFEKAAAACKKLQPTGGFGRFGGAGGFNSTAFAAYRNCLKLHGVTFPTGPRGTAGSTPPTTTAAEQSALQACAALRPSPTSTTTTTPG